MHPHLPKNQAWLISHEIKQIILIVFLAAILPPVAGIAYVFSLPPAERWLLMMWDEAQSYADALLSGDIAAQDRYRNGFADMATVANPVGKTVLFSSQADGRQFSLLYAPGRESAWLTHGKTGAKRIQEKWYAVEQ